MFGSQALETAVGLSLMFFILATAASAATEVISRLLKKRSGDLQKTLLDMLSKASKAGEQKTRKGRKVATEDARKEAADFMERLRGTSIWQAAEAAAGQSLLRLKPVGNSYLSAKSFAEAVHEVLISALPKQPDGTVDLAAAEEAINGLAKDLPESLQKRLEVLVGEAKHGILDVKAGLESWFDETMNRAEGAYKRWASLVLFLIGLAFAVIGNASTVDVARNLWQDTATRTAVAEASATITEDQTTRASLDKNGDGLVSVDEATDKLGEFHLPVGWDDESLDDFFSSDKAGWSVLTALGWLVTALLVMLGGPFWFDLLTKLVSLRGSGKKPPTAAEDETSSTSAAAAKPPAPGTPSSAYPTTPDALAAQKKEREDYKEDYKKELEPLARVLAKKRPITPAPPVRDRDQHSLGRDQG